MAKIWTKFRFVAAAMYGGVVRKNIQSDLKNDRIDIENGIVHF
jgi:hypothetical protein